MAFPHSTLTRHRFSVVLLACSCVSLSSRCKGGADGTPPPEPPPTLEQIEAVLGDPDTVISLLGKLPRGLEPVDLAKLREMDRQCGERRNVEQDPVARKLLTVLAASGDVRSLGYLHEVFEAAPERRDAVAHEIAKFALSQRRRPADWRLLVRAVPFVEGEIARDVLRALQLFNERGTKPQWQRQVLLAGLRLKAPDDREAVRVLRHWTGKTIDEGVAPEDALAAWQTWFDDEHPDLPPPTLPVDSADSRYKSADLLKLLSSSLDVGDPLRGAKVAEKATCLKCHRYGARGEAMGPDITNVRQRFQLKELLEEIIFPSQNLSDQYTTVIIRTRDGKTYSGVTAADGDDLVILQANGEKARIDRRTIEEAGPSRKSSMPDGLLEPLTQTEVLDLFSYLLRSER
ncbi:MAG: c-type cytochrome [Planctomycetaceae bacterium]|nr:c-type cytochrome [Planctomycetales bacterium]MCB9921793.1 c-type cytochrome [Planctomycetaceae bacterium]